MGKSNPLESTSKDASDYGRLRSQAKKVNKIAARRKLFQELLKCKVGTNSIEKRALKMAQEQKMGVRRPGDEGEKKVKEEGKGGKSKSMREQIIEGRDPEKVCDLLSLKVKYCEREEEGV